MVKFRAILPHALGLRTLAPMFIAGVGGWIALSDRNLFVDDPEFFALAFLGLVCGLMSWGVITFDSFEKDKEKAEFLAQICGLRASVEALTPTGPVNLRNLSTLTSAQLKELVARSVAELRMFDARVATDRTGSIHSIRDPVFDYASDQIQHALWQRDADARMRKRDEFTSEFRTNIRPLALALLEEMKSRCTLASPPLRPSVALEHGMLAGPHPAANAADELERYARALPDA